LKKTRGQQSCATVPLKGRFTKLKTNQKRRLKMAIWNINNSQAKNSFYCGSGLKKQTKCFPISFDNFNCGVKRSWSCSETTLTGEFRVSHKSPLGIEPGSLLTGSKGVDHWTSETMCECSEIAGSPQGSPPTADYVGCEAGRRTCSDHETGPEATMINYVRVTNIARQH
jgi:hypothetical protein